MINNKCFKVFILITGLSLSGLAPLALAKNILQAGNTQINSPETKQSLPLNKNDKAILSAQMGGWNHIENNPLAYQNLTKPHSAYQINIAESRLDDGKHTDVSTVLVRKLANWTQQHSNGFEIDLAANHLTFGGLKNITFDLLIDAKNSFIPSVEQATKYYLSYVEQGVINKRWLDDLLLNPVQLTFTLVGEHHASSALSNAVAVYRYNILPSEQKTHVNIHSSEFAFKLRQNYQDTDVAFSAISSQRISALIITLDTGNNKTLRSYINQSAKNDFPENMEEFFIELAVSLRDIHLDREL
ncbi:hypothetical protein ACOYR1_07455 [Thalassotalea piscium]